MFADQNDYDDRKPRGYSFETDNTYDFVIQMDFPTDTAAGMHALNVASCVCDYVHDPSLYRLKGYGVYIIEAAIINYLAAQEHQNIMLVTLAPMLCSNLQTDENAERETDCGLQARVCIKADSQEQAEKLANTIAQSVGCTIAQFFKMENFTCTMCPFVLLNTPAPYTDVLHAARTALFGPHIPYGCYMNIPIMEQARNQISVAAGRFAMERQSVK